MAHHAAYPRHEGFEVEIKDADACAMDASRKLQAFVGIGVGLTVSRMQPAFEDLGAVGGAAGGVPGTEGVEVEVRAELDNSEWSAKAEISEREARKLIRDLKDALRDLEEARKEAEEDRSHEW